MSSALDIVLVGKYHGCTHAAVAEADRSYCAWVASAASLPRSLLPFKMWLKRTHGGVLPYGKYKNRFFSEVFLEHPEYAVWACELRDPSDVMLEFQEYVRKREGESLSEDADPRPQPVPKRARGPPAESEGGQAAPAASSFECKVCFDRPIDTLIFPCKHLVLCERCAVLSGTCPVCRGRVSELIRMFPG